MVAVAVFDIYTQTCGGVWNYLGVEMDNVISGGCRDGCGCDDGGGVGSIFLPISISTFVILAKW